MSSSKGTGIIPSTFAFSFFTIIEKLQQDGFDQAYVRRLRAWLSANELTGMIRGDIKDMIHQGLKLVHHQEAQTEDRAPARPMGGRTGHLACWASAFIEYRRTATGLGHIERDEHDARTPKKSRYPP